MYKRQAQDIDREILDLDQLNDEEISLKRFQIIQDYLITHKDLPDPAYVDALCEEIYTKLYEENWKVLVSYDIKNYRH